MKTLYIHALRTILLTTLWLFTASVSSSTSNSVVEQFSREPGVVYFTTLSSTSVTQLYFERLLKVAMDNSTKQFGPYEIERFPVPMDQERQIRTVINGDADVLWSMSTPQRQREMLAVEFPLLKGLLGKRVFLVSKQNQQAFKGLTTEQLRQRVAVQGISWPDTKVLKDNGYNVYGVAWYDWQFRVAKLLTTNVVDYFPRSVMEATAELGLPHNIDLVVEPYHLLEYPAYVYFFVNPNKPKLRDRLLAGLKSAESNGDFERNFESYPSYHEAMKILEQSRTVHELKRFEQE